MTTFTKKASLVALMGIMVGTAVAREDLVTITNNTNTELKDIRIKVLFYQGQEKVEFEDGSLHHKTPLASGETVTLNLFDATKNKPGAMIEYKGGFKPGPTLDEHGRKIVIPALSDEQKDDATVRAATKKIVVTQGMIKYKGKIEPTTRTFVFNQADGTLTLLGNDEKIKLKGEQVEVNAEEDDE